ncbi:MAG: RNA-binding protein [Ignavibacteriae bacterium]|nr:RNA-binding protein [Ignavibacteriota bacterium]
MNIYIGNISRESSEDEIRTLFEEFGKVENINLIRDNYTKMLKGFGFIDMPENDEAEKAIKGLDGQMFNGRPLTVNVAKPKTDNKGGARPRRFRPSY